MKKIVKKLVCVSLAVVMLCGVMVGCGNKKTENSHKDDADEKVTLTMVFPNAKQKDADEVLAEVNKQLETLLPNTQLEIIYEANLADKWPLWMSTSKAIDIAHSGFSTVLEEEVTKNSYLELDTLIDEYAPNLKALQETYWYSYDSAKIGDKLYAIPNVQLYINNVLSLVIDENIAAHIDTSALYEEGKSSDKTSEKFWQIFDAGLEKAAANGVNLQGSLGMGLYEIAKKGYHFVGGTNSNLCYDDSDKPEIIDFYTTDEFKTFCSYMQKWGDKGYISPDALTDSSKGATWRRMSSFYVDEETGRIKDTSGGYVNNIFAIDDYNNKLTTNTGYVRTYWSIPYTAEHPVRAIRFLDLLHSEEGAGIANLLAYGFEDKHYEFVDKEKGDIKAFEYNGQGGSSVSYGIPNWEVCNMLQGMYQVYPYTHELRDYVMNYYTVELGEMEKHVLYGFSADVTAVKNQMSNILKNNSELSKNVYSGIVENSDATLKELMDKNQAAGIDKVMSEFQKQMDDYIKTH